MAKKSGVEGLVSLRKGIQQEIKEIEAGGGRIPTPEELEKAFSILWGEAAPYVLSRLIRRSSLRQLIPTQSLRPGLDPTAHPEYGEALRRLQGSGPEEDPNLTPSIDFQNN